MMTKQTKFILAIALQVVIIFAIIIFKVSVLSGGTSVLLRIEPIDPRDPLRGDYATFQYSDISNLDPYSLDSNNFDLDTFDSDNLDSDTFDPYNPDLDNLDSDTFDSDISGRQQFRNGDTIYIVLSRDGKYWTAWNIQKTKPLSGKVFLKGKVASGGIESQSDVFSGQDFGGSRIHVVYGIEEYFIPEGKGQGFSFWNKEAAARVVVDENGNAVLKQIYVEGSPWP